MKVFAWNDILQIISGKIPVSDLFEKGTAISVGSFDGPHIGHEKLLQALLKEQAERNFVPGVITFRRPLTGYKCPSEYKGDVSTLEQRLAFFKNYGIAFAVVIDFSDDFGRIEGRVFLEYLVKYLNMKFIAEGRDFHCGYHGATGIDQMCEYSKEVGFETCIVPPVLYEAERVSSSRIRQAVLDAAMDSVSCMLARPYALDCSNLVWKREIKENMFYLIAEKKLFQVFPAEGKYKVMAIMSGNSEKNGCRTEMIVESQFLRLQIPESVSFSTVRAIEFI